MRGEDVFVALGDVSPDLLEKANADRRVIRTVLRSFGAICACFLIGVSVTFGMTFIPKEYPIEYIYSVSIEEKNVTLEYENIWVYYEKNGSTVRKLVRMPLSAENVFLSWKYLNGIGDDVLLIECKAGYSSLDSANVIMRKIDIDGMSLTFSVSKDLADYGDIEVLLLSLDKTMEEYGRFAYGEDNENSLDDSIGVSHEHEYEYYSRCLCTTTCDHSAFIIYKCKYCSSEKRVDEELLPHTPGEWKVERYAAPDEDGELSLECLKCGKVIETKPLPYTESYGLGYRIDPEAGICTVTSIGECTENNLVIPEQISGYRVTGIGESAFYYNSTLESVVIPDGVESIGEYAFGGCSKLRSITVPGSVKVIPKGAFDGCTSLCEVIMGEGVKRISSNAFEDCTSLESVIFPQSLSNINDYAFWECTSLLSVYIPKNVINIGSCAFWGCDSLESIFVEDDNRFYISAGNCIIESYGGELILGCKNSEIPNDGSVRYIADMAFQGCRGLESIVIPEGVRTIGMASFKGCSSLKSVVLPKSLVSIGIQAFEDCTVLTSVEMHKNVEEILYYAFHNCPITITYHGTVSECDWVEIEIRNLTGKYMFVCTDGTKYRDY